MFIFVASSLGLFAVDADDRAEFTDDEEVKLAPSDDVRVFGDLLIFPESPLSFLNCSKESSAHTYEVFLSHLHGISLSFAN